MLVRCIGNVESARNSSFRFVTEEGMFSSKKNFRVISVRELTIV